MPEASVRRRVQALSGFTGRKGSVGGLVRLLVKAWGLTPGCRRYDQTLRIFGDAGTCGGGVKSVDITRNTDGEGGHLGNI